MLQVLEATETTGPAFRMAGGNPVMSGPQNMIGIQYIVLTGHAGGTWTVQFQNPENSAEWIDTDITFTANGAKTPYVSPELVYRLHGGTAGARAWATNAWEA